MWRAYARCSAARAKLSAPCTRVARATCCGCRRVRTAQRSRGHSASAPRHPASAGRARGEDGGGPGRARGECGGRRRHDFPIGGTQSCSHNERRFIHAPVRSAQRHVGTCLWQISTTDRTHARTGPDTQRAQAHNHTQNSNTRTQPRHNGHTSRSHAHTHTHRYLEYTMSPAACRTAIACALICQKR